MKKSFLIRGGLWVVGQSVLLAIVASLSVYYREQFTPLYFQLLIAVIVFALSAFTGAAGVIALGRNRTAFPTPVEDGALVSNGIYRVVRHPLYLSLMLWAISWALFWRSWIGIGAAVVVAVFFDTKARYEERFLYKTHPQYLDYARRVRRFVPGIYCYARRL